MFSRRISRTALSNPNPKSKANLNPNISKPKQTKTTQNPNQSKPMLRSNATGQRGRPIRCVSALAALAEESRLRSCAASTKAFAIVSVFLSRPSRKWLSKENRFKCSHRSVSWLGLLLGITKKKHENPWTPKNKCKPKQESKTHSKNYWKRFLNQHLPAYDASSLGKSLAPRRATVEEANQVLGGAKTPSLIDVISKGLLVLQIVIHVWRWFIVAYLKNTAL